MPARQIDLMIVGAQKAGTSSLHQYIAQHPRVRTHFQREITYFIDDHEYQQDYAKVFKRYFDAPVEKNVLIMGKSVGIMYLPRALERLRSHNSDMHLVVCLRHPIRRAYSAYWFARRMGWENIRDFETAIQAPTDRFGADWVRARNCAYLLRSQYAEHLRAVFSYFPRKQVNIFLTEDMRESIEQVCNRIYERLQIGPFIPDTQRNYNAAATARLPIIKSLLSKPSALKKTFRAILPDRTADRLKSTIRRFSEKEFQPPPISEKTFNDLVEYFQPYNEELSVLIGRDLSSWNSHL